MIRCSKCESPTARIVTGRELAKLSKKSFAQALAAGVLPAAASAPGALGAVGFAGLAVKKAAEASNPMVKLAIVAGGAIVTGLVKYGFDRLQAGSTRYVYCSNCGHQEPLKGG